MPVSASGRESCGVRLQVIIADFPVDGEWNGAHLYAGQGGLILLINREAQAVSA
jgi:hypothetical protein